MKSSLRTAEPKVYADFFTNLAVAWFTAGIIAPIFTPIQTLFSFASSVTAVVAAYISLQLALYYTTQTR